MILTVAKSVFSYNPRYRRTGEVLMNNAIHKKIYKTVLEILTSTPFYHKDLIEEAVRRLYGGIDGGGQVGEFTEIRGLIGAVISEMKDDGVILYDKGTYSLGADGPIPIRMEGCEKEILSLLSSKSYNKFEIRSHLRRVFKTDTTPSDSDDRILYNYMGQILRRLTELNVIEIIDGKYTLKTEARANIDDISGMLELKERFLARIHSKGGEFFEHYIMTLLKKNAEAHGKVVTECRVTGGSADGGIDGVIKTTDYLGFRETVLVQAKNRTDMTSETKVRSFLGSVYASGGAKGIYATTSDFHPGAKLLLAGIDNCIGVNGEDIFKMACSTMYGIRKKSGKLVIDNKIL